MKKEGYPELVVGQYYYEPSFDDIVLVREIYGNIARLNEYRSGEKREVAGMCIGSDYHKNLVGLTMLELYMLGITNERI